METAADIQTELQQVKLAVKKRQENKEVEIIEIRHRREERILMKQVREMKEFVRSLKTTNNDLKKDREERTEIQKKLQEELQTLSVINNILQNKCDTETGTEVKLRTKLERVKIANDNLNTYRDLEMKDCEEEKEMLLIRNQELQKELAAIKTNLPVELEQLKIANDNINKYWDSKMKDSEEEKNILLIWNQELRKEMEAIKINVAVELERMKIANDNRNKYWESKMKYCEEEKEIHLIRNQKLQKELEAIKTSVPVQNLQLVGSSSQPQQGRQCGIDTAVDGKVSLDNFQFIRRLGEGGSGTVVLAKRKLLGGPEQLYAVKGFKKRSITSSSICDIMAEKEALMLTTGHPFITTLYSCFQNKDHLFFCGGVYEWR